MFLIILMRNKNRKNIPQRNKVRAVLQKEVESVCPFCNNDDVGHFEIHHIDGNPSNNEYTNLILICPTCHSKITKEDISTGEVIKLKKDLSRKQEKVKFISVSVDSDNCSWRPIEKVEYAFESYSMKSLFPIFNFSFINNYNQTILLTNIVIRSKRLPVGLAGPDIPLPNILRPMIKYKIKMPADNEEKNYRLEDEIEVPAGRAFKFQLEIFDDSMNRFKPPFSKYVLYFKFGFNNDLFISVPDILLNSKEDYDELKYFWLG